MSFLRKYFILIVWLVVFINPSAKAAENPDTVKIGTYVVSLHDINFHNKEYIIRFWMWMLYANPQFDFANRVEVPNAKTLEKPEIMVDSVDGKIWVLLKMKCLMKQSWKVEDFPFDKQQLVVHVENSEFDSRSLVFVADTMGSHYDPDLTVDGWKIRNIKIQTSMKTYETSFGDSSLDKPVSEYASFDINLTLERNTWGLFLKLFICMYIAFFIAYMSFYIHADHVEASFGLQVGGLFASVGNKYIIDSLLPETPSFTLVDTLHAMTYLSIFFIIVFSVVYLKSYKKKNLEKYRLVERIGRVSVLLFYILFNIVFIGLAIWH